MRPTRISSLEMEISASAADFVACCFFFPLLSVTKMDYRIDIYKQKDPRDAAGYEITSNVYKVVEEKKM